MFSFLGFSDPLNFNLEILAFFMSLGSFPQPHLPPNDVIVPQNAEANTNPNVEGLFCCFESD
jgi:hypothetical protein